ncbi:hypothetical protein PMAYCL1PPCAC_24317, partial [Pristionchus mayeri]
GLKMAEVKLHEPLNKMWSSPMDEEETALVDHSEEETMANGVGEEDRVKEEIEDIEEEDPIDPDFVSRFGIGGSQGNLKMRMVNSITEQPERGMSSLITSTTPLDLATLLNASRQEESGEASQSTLHGRMKREASQGSSEASDVKRKASNREAANRYREKKKQELEVMRIDEEALIARNAELRLTEVRLMEDIREMREKMTATFGFAPPFEHEPSLLDINPCLLVVSYEKTPKRIPFPKGLSPAEQNRESVRRDREKKKARFEALRAEEAILSMGKDMLLDQVNKLEEEIHMLKERMRSVGFIIPQLSHVY